MPIIGLSDIGSSFPRIGELRKGAEKPTQGNRPGADLEYFRFTSRDPEAVKAFDRAYPGKPNNIRIFLPYQTTDENFDSWIEEWGKGSLKWRGDGETLHVWQKSDGTYSTEPRPQPEGGKPSGRLKVIIPELGRLAYVLVLTTSIHDIASIPATLRAYEAMRGNLQGIPFILSRVPRMVSTPTKDGRVRREKWLIQIEAAPDWVSSQLSVMQRQALPSIDGNVYELSDGLSDDDPFYDDDIQQAADDLVGDINAEFEKDEPESNPDYRAMLKTVSNPTIGLVCDYTHQANEYFNAPQHAMNALNSWDGMNGRKPTMKARLTNETAVKMFDWLIDYKSEA